MESRNEKSAENAKKPHVNAIDAELDEKIRDTIRRLILGSGEPYEPSVKVIDSFFACAETFCQSLSQRLSDYIKSNNETNNAISSHNKLDLRSIVACYANDPHTIGRINDYLRISCIQRIQNLYSTQPTKIDQLADFSQTNDREDSQVVIQEFVQLCSEFNIDSSKIGLRVIHSPGYRLRLNRIDSHFSQLSDQDYADFTRLRQSASFLRLTRLRESSPLRSAFVAWLVRAPGIVTGNSNKRHDRFSLNLLSHLLTGYLLDIIDSILQFRLSLRTDLANPLTPIEIEQVVVRSRKHQLSRSRRAPTPINRLASQPLSSTSDVS